MGRSSDVALRLSPRWELRADSCLDRSTNPFEPAASLDSPAARRPHMRALFNVRTADQRH